MKIVDWGIIDYETSVQRQVELVDQVAAGAEDIIVFCTHPPVVTLGRASTPEDLQGWTGSTVESSRGGRATYHGPNQLVIYPILDLRKELPFRSRDVHAYLRWLESVVVKGLQQLGIADAEARTTQIGEISLTGVWVGDKKVASIGIAVRKWVTYHGVAINVQHDPAAFRGIRPCGFRSEQMTSIEQILGQSLSRELVEKTFRNLFQASFAASKGALAREFCAHRIL